MPVKRSKRRALARAKVAVVDQFSESSLRLGIVVLVALKVAGLVLFFSREGFDSFQPTKSALSRVLEIVLVAGIALLVVRFGALVLPRTRLHLFVAAFAAVNVVAAVLAEDRYMALYGDITRYEGMT